MKVKVKKWKYNVINRFGNQESGTGAFDDEASCYAWYKRYGKEWEAQGRQLVKVEFEVEVEKEIK